MPITGKTPITDLGDSGDADLKLDLGISVKTEPTLGAPAPNFGSTPVAPAAPQQNLTQAGSNAAQGADVLVKHDKESEDWINKKWRPVMGWVYMATCTADFVVFPVMWSVLQTVTHQTLVQWQPLTLQGAGLYHIAMGAVLGIAAYGRTKEKLESKQ
jgi:hypothetical protein